MLTSQYQHSIDAKGRLIVPSKFRNDLGERFVVTKGFEKCLTVYPMAQWEALEAKMNSIPLSNTAGRRAARYFFAGAVECELDNQGRIMIPAHLKEHAGLKKEIVSVGLSRYVEIWDKDMWNDANNAEEVLTEETMLQLSDFDF